MNPFFLVIFLVAGYFAYGAIEGDQVVSSIIDPMTGNDDPFTEWDYLFHKFSIQFQIPWRWLKAICMNESNLGQAPSVAAGILDPFNIDASKSSDGLSWGLMQTTVKTANQFEPGITAVELNNPEISVRVASEYIQWVMKNYFDDEEDVVRAYNGGPGYTDASTNSYWNRYQSNMNTILSRQPGNRNEIG